jgi:hypothetical protein
LPISDHKISIDTIINDLRKIQLCITPNRQLSSIEINSNTKNNYKNFKINGTKINTNINSKFFSNDTPRIATYHVVNETPLELEFNIHKDSIPHIELIEVSHDLLTNKSLNVKKRTEEMIPKPFVTNDAIIVKNTLKLND